MPKWNVTFRDGTDLEVEAASVKREGQVFEFRTDSLDLVAVVPLEVTQSVHRPSPASAGSSAQE